MNAALFCLFVNTSLLQNVPSIGVFSPSFTLLPDITGSSLLSNVLEGGLFNMSFLGRTSQTPSQPYSIVKTSYQQDKWFQTILPVPPTTNPLNAVLRFTQDPLGNMWLIQLVSRGSTGTSGLSNLLYLPSLSNDVITVYNGTQFQLMDLQLVAEGMFLSASFASNGPVGLATYGIIGMNPPFGFVAGFPWLPGTQRSQAIQTFLYSSNSLYIAVSGSLETWLKNGTANNWYLAKSNILSANGAILKLSEGLLRNSLFCITSKLLLQIVFLADGSLTQTIIQSIASSSPISFRSIGLGFLTNPPTRSSLPSRRSTETASFVSQVSQDSTPSAVSQESFTSSSTQSSTATQSSVSTQAPTSTAFSSQYSTPSAESQTTSTAFISQDSTPSAESQTASAFISQDPSSSSAFSNDPTPSANQTIGASSESYIVPLTVSLAATAVGATGLVLLSKKLFLKKVFKQQPLPKKKVYQSVELARNPDLMLQRVSFEPQNWENQTVKFNKPVKLAFQPNVVPM